MKLKFKYIKEYNPKLGFHKRYNNLIVLEEALLDILKV